jgi:thioredoxin 1
MKDTSSLNLGQINQLKGLVLIEFGATWCSYCQAAQPNISAVLLNYPNVQHIKIEDGKGMRLGRQFSVKIWPTLIFLKDGLEVGRLVRPQNSQLILELLNSVICDAKWLP